MTTMTVTDDQIRTLRSEAAAAGDNLQVAICDRALGRDLDCEDPAPLTAGEALALGEHWPTRAAARAACAETILAGQG